MKKVNIHYYVSETREIPNYINSKEELLDYLEKNKIQPEVKGNKEDRNWGIISIYIWQTYKEIK